MDDSWLPEPDPSGALEPPRRNPPTAVGIATPPPPARRPRYHDRAVARRRRMASAFVGTVLTSSAVSLATVGTVWWALLSAGLGAIGGVLLYRAARPSRRISGEEATSLFSLGRRFSRKRRDAA
jgi:hypothetical protein